MLFLQLLERRGTRCFSGGALHNPLWRLQEDHSRAHSQPRSNSAANFSFDLLSIREKILSFHFRNNHNFFGSEVRIVAAKRYDATVSNRRVIGRDLFNVLRINILAAYNDELL